MKKLLLPLAITATLGMTACSNTDCQLPPAGATTGGNSDCPLDKKQAHDQMKQNKLAGAMADDKHAHHGNEHDHDHNHNHDHKAEHAQHTDDGKADMAKAGAVAGATAGAMVAGVNGNANAQDAQQNPAQGANKDTAKGKPEQPAHPTQPQQPNMDNMQPAPNGKPPAPATAERINEQTTAKSQTRSLLNINFDTAKSSIRPDSMDDVERVFTLLSENPDLKLSIEGHTDSSGNSAENQALSQRRAEQVKALLVEKGIDESRLKAVGYGDTKPLVDNDTAEHKAKNRRVEAVEF